MLLFLFYGISLFHPVVDLLGEVVDIVLSDGHEIFQGFQLVIEICLGDSGVGYGLIGFGYLVCDSFKSLKEFLGLSLAVFDLLIKFVGLLRGFLYGVFGIFVFLVDVLQFSVTLEVGFFGVLDALLKRTYA